jgi:hypothetical protein
MTTTTKPHPAVVALPPRAVRAEDWQPNGDGRFYRNFEGEIREVVAGRRYGAHAVAVYAHAVQHDDGAIIDNGLTDPVFEPPGISMPSDGYRSDPDQRCGAPSRRRPCHGRRRG